jgi:hypothetical protein
MYRKNTLPCAFRHSGVRQEIPDKPNQRSRSNFRVTQPTVRSIAGIDINTLGYVIVGLFLLTWAAALLIWRFARIERRWAFHGESGS